ncbi:MAG: hypothetical protein AAF914_15435 [Pseudomonadota bacterium]
MTDGWAPDLDPGERMVWEGRPDGRSFPLRGGDEHTIPFLEICLAAAVLLTVAVWLGRAPVLFWPRFLAVGVHLVAGPFVLHASEQLQTDYAARTGLANQGGVTCEDLRDADAVHGRVQRVNGGDGA